MSNGPPSWKKMIERTQERRERDAERYEDMDGDRCQLCHAHGADKRTLLIRYFYAIHEQVPEAIDLSEADHPFDGYLLRTCKACRGDLLGRLREWREERVKLREAEKDHDGHLLQSAGNIPVRVDGRTVMMMEEEYDEWRDDD